MPSPSLSNGYIGKIATWQFYSWAWCYVARNESLVNLSKVWLCPLTTSWQYYSSYIASTSAVVIGAMQRWCATQRWAVPLLQVLSSSMIVVFRGPQNSANYKPAIGTPAFIGPGTEGSEVAYGIRRLLWWPLPDIGRTGSLFFMYSTVTVCTACMAQNPRIRDCCTIRGRWLPERTLVPLGWNHSVVTGLFA